MQTAMLAGPTSSLSRADAVLRVMLAVLRAASGPAVESMDRTSAMPLLDVAQTAELLQVSRMTVVRLVDEHRLPSVIVRRGRSQKIRRIPRAFIDRLVAEANAGAQVDIEQFAKEWADGLARRADHDDETSDLS